MDNPHIRDVELAYLAGVIDGEGTITLERTGNRRMNGVMGLSPKVIIANTNESLLYFCANTMKKLGVNPHVKSQEAGKYNRGKTMYWLSVQGLTKSKKVLFPILPYLVAKLQQANLVLDFVRHRGESEEAKGKPYGQFELAILDKIRALNKRGMSQTEDQGLTRKVLDNLRQSNDSRAHSESYVVS